jgi:hypothetical protein
MLSETEQAEHYAQSMEQLTKNVEKEHYEQISNDEKQIVKLFI